MASASVAAVAVRERKFCTQTLDMLVRGINKGILSRNVQQIGLTTCGFGFEINFKLR
jgi:hypothetical protein